MKFGVHEVIHPLSTEKVASEKKVYVMGNVKSNVSKISQSYKVVTEMDPETITLKAIKEIKQGGSDYACIEIFTDVQGICRMNVCHMQEMKK